MNLLPTVAGIVAPVFILALVGFAWVRLGFEYRLEFVTRMATVLSMPALIFVTLMQSEIAPSALAATLGATVAAYGAITLATLALVRLAGLDGRTYLAPLIFGNTGNLGLPLAYFAFGDTGLGLALAVFAAMSFYAFTAGIWMVSGTSSLTRLIREPMAGAAVLGALFLWQGWHTPEPLTRALEMLGQMAIPLMLLTLGVAVARIRPRGLGRAFWLALVKAAICTAAGWAAALAFDLEPVAFGVLVVQMATPVAVTSYMIAAAYKADADAVAALVVASTLLSVLLLPALVAIVI